MNVWEALAGRASGEPAGPTDPGLWGAVVDRLNPARARPVLRAGIEAMRMRGVRGTDYILLRSPDDGDRTGYLRLTPQEWQLAQVMDGAHTVARLVAEFARIAGRLAPDQVRRVVADLAGHRMLDDLPTDAFLPSEQMRRRPQPERVARGRRLLTVDPDALITGLYRAGGKFFFGRTSAIVQGLLAVAGFGLFLTTWSQGGQSLFLTGHSYVLGVLTLLLLNVLVVLGHGLGHALATKHAGREVPAAGLVVWSGIPSFFVDTADAWMAGRRARMLVAAAGPLSSLMLAGVLQVIALGVPLFGGVAFKLAFLWYLNAFVHLSPVFKLDGHYLLMDWLEIPQLRPRALAWVGARLRGRPPRWSVLDREGRLIALYGILAVLWLVVAVNVAVRIWFDRVAELATGLRPAGAGGIVLLVLVVLALGVRPLCFLLGALTRGWRRLRRRSTEKDRQADVPRRLAALRTGDLGGLPEPALQGLAARARWVHAPPGRQVVLAGGSQSAVYLVVEGRLQARKPGDPAGTIRHQAGPGVVVGLVDALTGRSTQLDWYAAGATLLAIPTATVASVIGPLPGPPPHDRAEAEALFADTPALAGLGSDQRLALIVSAHPADLPAGAPVVLPGPTHAVVVGSGVIAMADGVELRRGTLIGPVGEGVPGVVAQARTPVRLWVIPDASDLPPLVGSGHQSGSPTPGSPATSITPADVYPPLAVPPGVPGEDGDSGVDQRFERRLWWLAAVVLIVALVLTGATLRPGPAWAEMPGNRALLTVDRVSATAHVDGETLAMRPGDRRYVGAGSQIEVPATGVGRLTLAGGASVLLCAGSRIEVGALRTDGGRQRDPYATLSLHTGRILAGTGSTSGAFRPLSLTVTRAQGDVSSAGGAWFAVELAAVTVSSGSVSVAGTAAVPVDHTTLSCGDGVPVSPPPASVQEPPAAEPLPSESAAIDIGSVPPSTGTTPIPSLTPGPATTGPLATTAPARGPTTIHLPTTRPTSRPSTTTRPTTPATVATTAPSTTEPTTTGPTSDPAPTDDPTTPPASSSG